MRQPRRKEVDDAYPQTKVKKNKTKKPSKQYGTSKLEVAFAKEFLDKLGVEYIYQFEAKSIGRFYDFYLPTLNLIIEVDGDYFHSNPKIYEGKELTPTQKKNKRVDKLKDMWAHSHCIPILRIWENDIRKNPSDVMNTLKEMFGIYCEVVRKELDKKKRH